MIDEKKIEEAAQRYCNVTDANKNEASLLSEGFKEGAYWMMGEFLKENMFYKAKDKRIQDILELGYARITNEFLESLWHDASEEPQKGKKLVGYDLDGYSIYCWTDQEETWKEFVYNSTLGKWCYIDDLLPEEGGEG